MHRNTKCKQNTGRLVWGKGGKEYKIWEHVCVHLCVCYLCDENLCVSDVCMCYVHEPMCECGVWMWVNIHKCLCGFLGIYRNFLCVYISYTLSRKAGSFNQTHSLPVWLVSRASLLSRVIVSIFKEQNYRQVVKFTWHFPELCGSKFPLFFSVG